MRSSTPCFGFSVTAATEGEPDRVASRAARVFLAEAGSGVGFCLDPLGTLLVGARKREEQVTGGTTELREVSSTAGQLIGLGFWLEIISNTQAGPTPQWAPGPARAPPGGPRRPPRACLVCPGVR